MIEYKCIGAYESYCDIDKEEEKYVNSRCIYGAASADDSP